MNAALLKKSLNKISFTVICACVLQSHPVYACSMCFYGSPDDAQNKALRSAVLIMLGLLAVLMALFIKFLITFNKRSAAHRL